MSQKHKLTKTVKTEIRIAIEGLPVMYKQGTYKRVLVKGKRLISEGITMLGDEPVDEQGTYGRNERVRINHYEEAKKEYRDGGVTALLSYIVHVKTTVKNEEKDSIPNN